MFQIIENWEKRKVIDSISIEGLVDRVRNPTTDFLQKVEEIRKYPRKSKEYEKIKKTLPCFTTAFNFNGYISNKNLGKATGYLYLDVDNVDEIKLDHPSVVFYCKSISGKGYSIIVGVKGITPENIKEATRAVAQELDIELDEGAISKDRLTILSYDINSYYNPQHTYLYYSNNEVSCTPNGDITSINIISNDYKGYKIRKNNLPDILENVDFNGELFKKFEDGKIGYTTLTTPFNEVKDGYRNSTMNTICYLMKGLNPHLDKETTFSYLQSINSARFSPPLSDIEISSIINSIFRIDKITLYPNTFRTYLYNPDYSLTTKEKRSVTMKDIHKQRKDKTLQEIEDCIGDWDFSVGKITHRKLVEESKKNKKTIARYYPQLKQKINILNLSKSNK